MKRITRVFSSILLALPLVATGCGGGKQLYGPDSYSCGTQKDANQYCKDSFGKDWACVDGTCEDLSEQQPVLYGPPSSACAAKDNPDKYCQDTFGKVWVCNKDKNECMSPEDGNSDGSSDANSDAASDNG